MCLSCGEAFDQHTGGSVVFRADAEREAWQVRRGGGQVSDDPPNLGRFCTRHIGPASLVAGSLSITEAMPLLRPEGRAPLEYREHLEGVEVNGHEHGEPDRPAFLPVSAEFAPEWTDSVAITPQIESDVYRLLAKSVWTIGAGLGVDHFRHCGYRSSGGQADDVASLQSNDMSAFLFRRVPHTLMLQRRQQTILEIIIAPAEAHRSTPDGELLLERLEVRASTAAIAESVRPDVDALIALLREDVLDPFDLAPDLIGVDVHGAELRRTHASLAGALRWQIEPTPSETLVERLLRALPLLVELVGGRSAPDIEVTSDRTYDPVDWVQPPDCPYTDTSKHRGATESDAGTLSVELESRRQHWDEDHLNSEWVSMHVRLGEAAVSASFLGDDAGCTEMMMLRPVVAGSVEALISVVGVAS